MEMAMELPACPLHMPYLATTYTSLNQLHSVDVMNDTGSHCPFCVMA